MMKEKKQPTSPTRRRFLTAGLATGAAGAAAVALGGTPAKAATEAGTGKSSGYRETEHVRKYYELARF
jgi:nitrous oxide reductase